MAEHPGKDELIRALALDGRARIVAARTTHLVEELRAVHGASPPVTAALGRAATGALLLASLLEKVTRREPVLTLEIDGDGPAGRIVATASPAGWVRGFARHPAADAPPVNGKLGVAGVVGTAGSLSVVRDIGSGEPYRGVVPLVSGEIAQDLAYYLRESEQTACAVALGVFVSSTGAVTHAGGYLVQLLPETSDADAVELERRARELGEVTRQLRDGRGPGDWLAQMFPAGFELVERYPVEFRCSCSPERVDTALKLLGPAELRELIQDAREQPVEVACGFCRKTYQLERPHLEGLLREIA